MMRRRLVLALAALSIVLGCGYRPLRSGLAGTPRIRVEGAVSHVPGGTTALADEAVRGARGELARWGALADADATDRLRIEIVRLDEASEGVASVDEASGTLPRARGVRVRITARGTIEGSGGHFETRDVEASEVVAVPAYVDPGDALAWEAGRSGAVRTLARTVGARIAREVLGIP